MFQIFKQLIFSRGRKIPQLVKDSILVSKMKIRKFHPCQVEKKDQTVTAVKK